MESKTAYPVSVNLFTRVNGKCNSSRSQQIPLVNTWMQILDSLKSSKYGQLLLQYS